MMEFEGASWYNLYDDVTCTMYYDDDITMYHKINIVNVWFR